MFLIATFGESIISGCIAIRAAMDTCVVHPDVLAYGTEAKLTLDRVLFVPKIQSPNSIQKTFVNTMPWWNPYIAVVPSFSTAKNLHILFFGNRGEVLEKTDHTS